MQYSSSVDEYTSQFRQRLHDAVSLDHTAVGGESSGAGIESQKPWTSLAAANRQRLGPTNRKISPGTADVSDYPAPSDIFSMNSGPKALLTGDVPSVGSSPSGDYHVATAASHALDAHTAASIAQGFLDEYRAAMAKASIGGMDEEGTASDYSRSVRHVPGSAGAGPRSTGLGAGRGAVAPMAAKGYGAINAEGMSLAHPAELASVDDDLDRDHGEGEDCVGQEEAGEGDGEVLPVPGRPQPSVLDGQGVLLDGQTGGKPALHPRDKRAHRQERSREGEKGSRRHRSSSRRREGGREDRRRGKREGSRRRKRRDSSSSASSYSSHSSLYTGSERHERYRHPHGQEEEEGGGLPQGEEGLEEDGYGQAYLPGQEHRGGAWGEGSEHGMLHMPVQGGIVYPMPSLAQPAPTQQAQQQQAGQVPPVVQDAAGSVRPQSDLVLVPIKALRDNAAALAEVESNMRAVQGEREGLLMRLEGMAMRVQQVEAERDQQAQECARLRQALAGKDDMIALLQGQLMGAQGSVAQAAASAAVQAATASTAHGQGMSVSAAEGSSSVSEEEFLLLSDEVGALQAQLDAAHRELEGARAQLAAPGVQAVPAQAPPPGAYGAYGPAVAEVSPPAAAAVAGAAAASGSGGAAAVGVFKGRQQGQQSYDDLSNENTRLKQQLAASGEEVAMLRTQATSAAAVRADIEQQLRAAQEQADKARSALDAARAQAAESEREAKRTAANLATSESEADKARRRAVEAESRGESLARTLEGTQHDLRAAQAALEEAHRAVGARNAEIQELREAVRVRNAEVQQARAEVEGSRAELQRARAEVDRLRGQLQQAQAQVQQLAAQTGVPAPLPPPGPVRGRASAAQYSVPEATGLMIGGGSGQGEQQGYGQGGGRGRVQQQPTWHQQQQADIEPSLSRNRPPSNPGRGVASYDLPEQPDYPPHPRQAQGSPGRYSHAQAQQVSLTDGRSRLFGASENYSQPSSAPPIPSSRRASTSAPVMPQPPSAPGPGPGPMEPPYGVPSGGPRSPPRKGGVGVAARQLESSIAWAPAPAPLPMPAQPPSPPRQLPPAQAVPAQLQAYAPPPAQEAAPANPYGRPTAPPPPGPYGSASAVPAPVANPYGGTGPQTAQPAQNAAAAERARRLAMLADLAGGSNARPAVQALPPPVPSAYAGAGPGASAYDAHAMAVLDAGEAYKRARAPAVGDGGHLMHANQSSAETMRALPFGSEAARAVEDDLRAAAVARPTKEDADAQSKAREASAPFATEAAVQSLEAQIQTKEAQLLSANLAKTDAEAELKRLAAGGGRTVRDRARKAELEGQLAGLEKTLAELRRWLKTHAP